MEMAHLVLLQSLYLVGVTAGCGSSGIFFLIASAFCTATLETGWVYGFLFFRAWRIGRFLLPFLFGY